MYAIAWEDDCGGCVETFRDKFSDAVFEASKIFASCLVFSESPEEFAEACAGGLFVRVDVYECDDGYDADRQFADRLFVPVFHLDSGMNFWG